MWLIFKTEMLIYHSKADLDEKILFSKITHQLDSGIRTLLLRACFGTKIQRSILVHNLHAICIDILFLNLKCTLNAT